MKTYLLDTNIWSYWYRQESFVLQKIKLLEKDSFICLSSVVWGEIIYGARANTKFDFTSYRQFIYQVKPMILQIDKNVSEVYGELRAKLFEKFTEKNGRGAKRPEQLIDPITATQIGIDENDLWIVSQAITYDMTLITSDKMNKIFSITPPTLKYEIWR